MLYLEQRNAFYLFVPGVSVPSVVTVHVKRHVLCKIRFLLEGRGITSGNKITRKLIFVNRFNHFPIEYVFIYRYQYTQS